MKNIITISREFGSGGRTIAKEAAQRLGYAFYDKDLIRGSTLRRMGNTHREGLILDMPLSGETRRAIPLGIICGRCREISLRIWRKRETA